MAGAYRLLLLHRVPRGADRADMVAKIHRSHHDVREALCAPSRFMEVLRYHPLAAALSLARSRGASADLAFSGAGAAGEERPLTALSQPVACMESFHFASEPAMSAALTRAAASPERGLGRLVGRRKGMGVRTSALALEVCHEGPVAGLSEPQGLYDEAGFVFLLGGLGRPGSRSGSADALRARANLLRERAWALRPCYWQEARALPADALGPGLLALVAGRTEPAARRPTEDHSVDAMSSLAFDSAGHLFASAASPAGVAAHMALARMDADLVGAGVCRVLVVRWLPAHQALDEPREALCEGARAWPRHMGTEGGELEPTAAAVGGGD